MDIGYMYERMKKREREKTKYIKLQGEVIVKQIEK